ncbi:hypothetical protein B0H16DRAFT_1719632 [Mycena metata]|uniref:Uncharacterized protein n=1 Tax=Mycena metata TaxID=1033252 RepID=A0AAD7NH70_9AGAR|nr:hypothetical protein B0H16DRAFT_1719632 [Mycena metata]
MSTSPTPVLICIYSGGLAFRERAFQWLQQNIAQRIRDKEAAGVPFMIGNTEDGARFFALDNNNLAAYLAASFGTAVTPAQAHPWYSSDLFEICGIYNRTGVTADETIYGNSVKDHTTSPAPMWPKYVPGSTTNLAKLAYMGNVALSNVVQAAVRDFLDMPCDALWD